MKSNLIKYEFLKKITKEELKQIQLDDVKNYIPGANVVYQDPIYDCNLYRVTYKTTIPEKCNKCVIVSGLISIPIIPLNTKKLSMVSYQHGTVLGKYDVPSFIENSFETRLVLAQLCGFGYIVIAADYVGLGISNEYDSYIVLDCQSQNSLDLYYAALEILKLENIELNKFYLCGWSQGGLVSLAFLEKIEKFKININAAATAACQNDAYGLVSQILNFPRNIDAPWLPSVFILTIFSFENYYNKCISRHMIKPNMYNLAKRIYLKDPKLKQNDFNFTTQDLLDDKYFDPSYFKNSNYGKLALTTQPYKFIIKTKLNMHYGEIDESITALTCQLCKFYQDAIGNKNIVNAISEGEDANHRRTFARALPKWRDFFGNL
jgi:hypothetical protein